MTENTGLKNGQKEHEASMIFPLGKLNQAMESCAAGRNYISSVSDDLLKIDNITFEPGSRTSWHIHHADKHGGEVLICVAGRGFYQEWGKDAVEMNPGDCISVPTGVKNWHGAAPETWFSYMCIDVPGENKHTEYLALVSDDDYEKLRKTEAEAAVSEEAVMNTAIMHISINEQWPYGTMKKYWLEGDQLAIEYETGKVIYYHMEDGYWEPEDWVVIPE